jgi:hypothetical protein
MKHIVLASITGLALVTGVGSASAADHAMSNKSSKMPMTQSMATDSLSLTTSQQKQAWNGIESQATKQNAPASFTASIGATVPQEIKLSPVPAKVANEVPKLRPYDYALISNKLLIVNPKDKKIVDVIRGSV